ncbi:bifunctional hydroxymethylpyrimidine kinase/phosphomethylpyrimidine kinase, partial [Seonamhaeicola marinus]|uniref:bifunctional hydroxymethylpyrimidine kinase/phosphomethylpyrimidine kinase n=1 Tax=Seonamhaeicola marinus TaxID=1912246 RepID=UPI001FE909E3
MVPHVKTVYNKHGSGCVLSSALASQICLGLPLDEAAVASKIYIERFLNSSQSLLGVHN